MWDSKLFRAGIYILLLFLLILIGREISFIFIPLVITFEVLFFSVLIAGSLYYIMVPLVDWFAAKKLPRKAGSALTFILIVLLVVALFALLGPSIEREIINLVDNAPQKLDELMARAESLEEVELISQLLDLDLLQPENLYSYIENIFTGFFSQASTILAIVVDLTASIFITVVITPFLLFYMLVEKGGKGITGLIDRVAPEVYAPRVKQSLEEINSMLAAYVQGLLLVCLFVGLLAYIGFAIIGLDFAIILGIFIAITNVIPMLGPFIGAIPAVLLGFTDSPLMAIKVVVVVVIVQQLDSLLLRPQIVGRKVAMSPLAVILVVLIAGRLGGLLGIILAVPIFTVLKIVVAQVYEAVYEVQQEREEDIKHIK